MASTTESEITAKHRHFKMMQSALNLEMNVTLLRTENEPCLTELQVDAKVSLEADVRDGDICARFPTQVLVLPEAMPDTCQTDAVKEQNQNKTVWNVQKMEGGGGGAMKHSHHSRKRRWPRRWETKRARQQCSAAAGWRAGWPPWLSPGCCSNTIPEDLTQSYTRKCIYQVCWARISRVEIFEEMVLY